MCMYDVCRYICTSYTCYNRDTYVAAQTDMVESSYTHVTHTLQDWSFCACTDASLARAAACETHTCYSTLRVLGYNTPRVLGPRGRMRDTHVL